MQDYALALLEDGSVPQRATPEEELRFPACFRTAQS